MFDLAGVRVSLYFPGDRDKADALISDLFTVMEKKQFPEQSKTPTYNKRPGIGPTITGCISVRRTYRPTRKYVQARIEIQVASVLMHAWSEVEHDLIYKPLQRPVR